MPGIPLRLTLVLGLLAGLVSCAPRSRTLLPPPDHPIKGGPIQVPDCAGFQLSQSEPFNITVFPGDTTVVLGPGATLRFFDGAVTDTATYTISYLNRPGRKAGILIDVVNGPAQFTEPVVLRLYFGSCAGFPGPGERKSMVRYPGAGSGFHWLGGTMSENGDYVEAYISDFSGFAIAI